MRKGAVILTSFVILLFFIMFINISIADDNSTNSTQSNITINNTGNSTVNSSATFSPLAPPPAAFISITLSNSPINFGTNASAGSTVNALNNPLIITVSSNVNFDITTRANSSSFSTPYGDATFPVSNMKWLLGPGSPLTSYTISDATVYFNQTATSSGNFSIYHKLTIPVSQKAGTYSVNIVITAKQTGT